MERAVSSGWTCAQCGARRIRTIVMDSVPAKGHSRPMGVHSKCPACGNAELITAEPGERIVSIQYGPA